MLIILMPDGTAHKVTPERVFQGSNDVQAITVQGSFAKQTAMKVAFELPNATVTQWYPMTYVGAEVFEGVEISTWTFALPYSVTQVQGALKLSMNAITGTAPSGSTTYTGQNVTSYTCVVQVEPSIPGLTPEIIPDDFDRLLAMYQALAAQIGDIHDAAESAAESATQAQASAAAAQQSAEEAKQAAESAAPIAREALDTANQAFATATKASEDVAELEKQIVEKEGTKVYIADQPVTRIDFKSDPQEQLDALAQAQIDTIYPAQTQGNTVYISDTLAGVVDTIKLLGNTVGGTSVPSTVTVRSSTRNILNVTAPPVKVVNDNNTSQNRYEVVDQDTLRVGGNFALYATTFGWEMAVQEGADYWLSGRLKFQFNVTPNPSASFQGMVYDLTNGLPSINNSIATIVATVNAASGEVDYGYFANKFTTPSGCTRIGVVFTCNWGGAAANNNYYLLEQPQVEMGQQATPYVRYAGTTETMTIQGTDGTLYELASNGENRDEAYYDEAQDKFYLDRNSLATPVTIELDSTAMAALRVIPTYAGGTYLYSEALLDVTELQLEGVHVPAVAKDVLGQVLDLHTSSKQVVRPNGQTVETSLNDLASSVQYTPQELTEDQKTQVLENLSVANVRYRTGITISAQGWHRTLKLGTSGSGICTVHSPTFDCTVVYSTGNNGISILTASGASGYRFQFGRISDPSGGIATLDMYYPTTTASVFEVSVYSSVPGAAEIILNNNIDSGGGIYGIPATVSVFRSAYPIIMGSAPVWGIDPTKIYPAESSGWTAGNMATRLDQMGNGVYLVSNRMHYALMFYQSEDTSFELQDQLSSSSILTKWSIFWNERDKQFSGYQTIYLFPSGEAVQVAGQKIDSTTDLTLYFYKLG